MSHGLYILLRCVDLLGMRQRKEHGRLQSAKTSQKMQFERKFVSTRNSNVGPRRNVQEHLTKMQAKARLSKQ